MPNTAAQESLRAAPPNLPVRLRTMLAWSAVGQIAYVVSQFGIVVALTRWTSVEDVGRFGLALALATPIVVLCNLGLRVGQATDVDDIHAFPAYLGLRILTTAVAVPVICLIGWLASSDPETQLLILLVAAMKGIGTFSDLFYGVFQKHQRMDLVARSAILRGPVTFVAFAAVLWHTRSAASAFLSQALIWFGIALLHDYAIARRREGGRPRFERHELAALFRTSLPLGIGAFLTDMSNTAPRVVTGWLLGIQALGHFTPFSYVTQAGIIGMATVSNPLYSRLARLRDGRDRKAFGRLIAITCIAVAFAGLIATAAGHFYAAGLVSFAFGPPYVPVANLLPILLLAVTLHTVATVLQTGLLAQRRFVSFARARLYLSLASIVGAVAGASYGALEGVAWSIVVVGLLQVSSMAAMLRASHMVETRP